jgi:nitrate reductase beta subunit
MLKEADCTVEEAEAIYKLTTLCTFEERFVIPPMQREKAMESLGDPFSEKAEAGFGFMSEPKRGS